MKNQLFLIVFLFCVWIVPTSLFAQVGGAGGDRIDIPKVESPKLKIPVSHLLVSTDTKTRKADKSKTKAMNNQLKAIKPQKGNALRKI